MKSVIDKFSLDESYIVALNNRIALSTIGLGINEMNSTNSYSKKIQNIKSILNSKPHKNALRDLSLSYFPIHWKIFFYFANIVRDCVFIKME